MRVAVTLIAVLGLATAPRPVLAQESEPNSPQELLDAWVRLWGSYDLDVAR